MEKLILASTSPRRKRILEQVGFQFQVIASDFEENMTINKKPKELVKYFSFKKAEAVVKKLKKGIVIGADTIVVCLGEIMGKPKGEKDAKRMLKKISGRKISVITGFTIWDVETNKKITRAVESSLYIKRLTDQEISNYIETKEPLDKAGAFSVQGKGALIVKKTEGDYQTIVGLPIYDIAQELKSFGIKIF